MRGNQVVMRIFGTMEWGSNRSFKTFVAMLALVCSGCSESMLASGESNTLPAETNPVAIEEEEKAEAATETRQRTAIPQLMDYTALCEEVEQDNPDNDNPILVKTCTYKNYKAVETGSPDYKGRYIYTYQLYKAEAGQYLEISNKVLFNSRQNELLALINQKVKADYLELANALETKECFEGAETVEDFEMSELGISFETDAIVFHAEFGLSDACLAVDGTSVSFSLKEIEKYLNK